MKKIKKWFEYLWLMIRPIWQQNKVFFLSYILWDCLQSPISTMLYVFLMEISINQLSSGVGFYSVAITILIFLSLEIVIHLGGDILFSFYFEPTQTKIANTINVNVSEHLKKTDFEYFDNPEFFDEYTLSYAKYASNSFDAFRNLSSTLSLFVTIGSLIGYIISSTAYVLIITVIFVLIKVLIGKKQNKLQMLFEEDNTPVARKSSYYHSTLCSRDAAMDIKCTGLFRIISDYYKKATTIWLDMKKKQNKQLIVWSSLQILSADGSAALIRTIICYFIIGGSIGVGSFVSLVSAANSLSWKMQNVSKYYAALDKSALHGKRIRHFLDLPSKIENALSAKEDSSVDPNAMEIRFDNVCFCYPNSNFSIRNINMVIRRGQKIAIVGENGGGKTTLTKLILRLYDPSFGEIKINGKPLSQMNVHSFRSAVGVAFQDSTMYSISLKDNLSVYTPYSEKVPKMEAIEHRINKILKKNDATIDTDVTKKFTKSGIVLSGGERQFIAVSRLFSKKFGLLIFDEPSSALDPFAEERLNQMIFDRSNDTTSILISHRLSNVVRADNIYVMKDGEIIENGTHKELMEKKGVYYCMFKMQSEQYIDD